MSDPNTYWLKESDWLYSQFGNRRAFHAGCYRNLPTETTYKEHGANHTITVHAETLSMMGWSEVSR